jgi:hypothetical protein
MKRNSPRGSSRRHSEHLESRRMSKTISSLDSIGGRSSDSAFIDAKRIREMMMRGAAAKIDPSSRLLLRIVFSVLVRSLRLKSLYRYLLRVPRTALIPPSIRSRKLRSRQTTILKMTTPPMNDHGILKYQTAKPLRQFWSLRVPWQTHNTYCYRASSHRIQCRTRLEAVLGMKPSKKRRKDQRRTRSLKLPELQHCKTAVLNTLRSFESRRTYEHVTGRSVITTEFRIEDS